LVNNIKGSRKRCANGGSDDINVESEVRTVSFASFDFGEAEIANLNSAFGINSGSVHANEITSCIIFGSNVRVHNLGVRNFFRTNDNGEVEFGVDGGFDIISRKLVDESSRFSIFNRHDSFLVQAGFVTVVGKSKGKINGNLALGKVVNLAGLREISDFKVAGRSPKFYIGLLGVLVRVINIIEDLKFSTVPSIQVRESYIQSIKAENTSI